MEGGREGGGNVREGEMEGMGRRSGKNNDKHINNCYSNFFCLFTSKDGFRGHAHLHL